MSRAPHKAADFLAAMRQSEPAAEPVEPSAPPAAAPATVHEIPRSKSVKAKPPTRAGLKHFGGYLDDDTLEKIALLRVRLKKDNSELIKQAIEELYRKHNAKRAFGDA
jgi:Ribbon-helix-helix protein, copG family